ncbi:MAG: hypothetical protein ACR2IS_13075 [Nitrososphaeraceae archaeon]
MESWQQVPGMDNNNKMTNEDQLKLAELIIKGQNQKQKQIDLAGTILF